MEPPESLMRRIGNPSLRAGVTTSKGGYDLVHARFEVEELRSVRALPAALG